MKDVAVAAAEELRRYGWLDDGSLQGARLAEANLAMANLEGAVLDWANLQGARLDGANLQEANLVMAKLEGARLDEAKLEGANLSGAFLVNAKLQGAELSKYTTLPDGTDWTPGTDMARFTDSRRADFWQPDF